ncbi:uncharacterized protein LOC128234948 isoform X1 [Mya arenaria]|uniref:uncharacterized protein LOC128234948 isoform X1 n=1 Tax=Mya arenaria TaxID=6604 RepID=UPI0022E04B23|nr:uncharacterized protein LOC128234948 isoform X1 [Mya arenaria]
MAYLLLFHYWICISTIFHTGFGCCPSNSRVFTQNGQTKVLKFRAPINPETEFATYRVARYDGITDMAVNYQYGKVIGEPTLQNCSLATSANIGIGILHIEINPVVEGDKGTYKLTELIETTTVIACLTLYILGTPTQPILSASGSSFVNSILTLTCTSSSTTQPSNHSLSMQYAWAIDGTVIQPGDRFSFDAISRKTLIISKLLYEDNGNTVNCIAIENEGKSSMQASYALSVFYGPNDASVNASDVITVNEHEDVVTIRCDADCRPPCLIQWTNLTDGNKRLMNELAFGRVNRYHAGTYECKAKTSVTGVIKMSIKRIQLIVLTKPWPPTHLQVISTPGLLHAEWTKAFNGGSLQSFLLQISYDNIWKNLTQVNENDWNNMWNETVYQVNITNVEPGKHSVRVIAFNKVGYADPVLFMENDSEQINFQESTSGADSLKITVMPLSFAVAFIFHVLQRDTIELWFLCAI